VSHIGQNITCDAQSLGVWTKPWHLLRKEQAFSIEEVSEMLL
jgi:hypothetical protein